VVLTPFTVTTSCNGKAPLGTDAADTVPVEISNLIQFGSAEPSESVTRTELTVFGLVETSAVEEEDVTEALLATGTGKVTENPVAEEAKSLGTETLIRPGTSTEGVVIVVTVMVGDVEGIVVESAIGLVDAVVVGTEELAKVVGAVLTGVVVSVSV
jgi:hypothetical protein